MVRETLKCENVPKYCALRNKSQAIDKLLEAEFTEERNDALDPSSFVFTEMQEMYLLLEQVVDILTVFYCLLKIQVQKGSILILKLV